MIGQTFRMLCHRVNTSPERKESLLFQRWPRSFQNHVYPLRSNQDLEKNPDGWLGWWVESEREGWERSFQWDPDTLCLWEWPCWRAGGERELCPEDGTVWRVGWEMRQGVSHKGFHPCSAWLWGSGKLLLRSHFLQQWLVSLKWEPRSALHTVSAQVLLY